MKKRFLIMALIVCVSGAFVSCKKKEKPEENTKETTNITVKEKEVNENVEETKEENKKTEENKEEKGISFGVKDKGNNDVTLISKKDSKIPFDIFTVGMDFKLKIDGKDYSFKDAVAQGLLDEKKLFNKLEQDKKDGKSTSKMYKDDGATIIYKYNDYSIVKYNSTDGTEDMYITKAKDLDALEAILNKR